MQNFLWRYFSLTGDIQSFVFYKEWEQHAGAEQGEPLLAADELQENLDEASDVL